MKKVIIWAVCFIAAAAVIIAGVLLVSSYINKKPERLAEKFKEEIYGTWTGDYDISNITFNQDGTAQLKVLGVGVDGTYTVTYNETDEQYYINLNYNSSIGLSVSKDFKAVHDGINSTLTLNDKESGMNLTFKRDQSQNADDQPTTSAKSKSGSLKNSKDVKAAIIGKWVNSGDNGGYVFYEDGSVDVSLSSFTGKGTYTVSADDSGKCRLKISYKTAIGLNISNSYYAEISDGTLSLSQVGAENIVLKYTKA